MSLVRWRGMVIPFQDTDCSSRAPALWTFVVCFRVNSPPLKSHLRLLSGFLFYFRDRKFEMTLWRVGGAWTPLLFGASSSLSSFSSSWRPLGRAAESPSPPSPHPQSALAPPSSTFLLFSLTKPPSQELTTCVICRGSLLTPCGGSAESVYVCQVLHWAEFLCAYLWFLLSACVSPIRRSY